MAGHALRGAFDEQEALQGVVAKVKHRSCSKARRKSSINTADRADTLVVQGKESEREGANTHQRCPSYLVVHATGA